MSKTIASKSLSAICSIVLLLLFLSACHFRKKIEHKAIVNQPIQALPLKLVDSSYAKTIPQPQPLKHAKFLSKADYYHQAFDELKAMLEGQKEANFERAVFLSENPYYVGRFSYSAFQNSISAKQMFIEKLIEANDQSDTIDFNVHVNEYGRFKLADIRYLPHQRKELYRKALRNWAIFKYITDTVFIHTLKDSALYTLYHAPYSYATADPFGMKDWSNSQVINLLISDDNKGNCFALTALYKILSDRLNADAKLCTAPQHIYIQHQDPKGQYYNVELATAGHPGDGIIQTLTYTPSEAIISGIALRDYDSKQNIGLCLINLAKSYEHTFITKDDEFMLRCAELALKYDSLNLNALLLKAQVLDARVTQYAITHKINDIAKLKQDRGILPLVNKLENHLTLLYRLGYREMPLDMQEQIMNPFGYDTKKWNHVSRNARPFTSFEPKDPKDAEYWTLTKGMFKEVWEPTAQEKYGHYTLTTATGKLKSIDTSNHKGQLIDPVAFAYDFGARIYDARIGHFVSTDPLQAKYPGLSPYNFCNNNPIIYKDGDGREIWPTTAFKASSYYPVLNNLLANNSTFLLIAGEFNKKGHQNVIVGVDPHKIPTRAGGITKIQTSPVEIFGIRTGETEYAAEMNIREDKGNNLSKAAFLIHEFVHLYVGVKEGNDNDQHDKWDDYMFLMRAALKEYSDDNNLNLSNKQIKEISIVTAGKGTTVYDSYIKEAAKNNKTSIEVEEKSLSQRVNDLAKVSDKKQEEGKK